MRMRLGCARDYDCELLTAVHGCIGPRRRLMVDGNALYSLADARRIGRRADEIGLRFAPHTWSAAVALAANMHLVASHSRSLTVQFDRTVNPFVDELLTEPFEIRDGKARLPREPGLGIELDEDVVGRHDIPRSGPMPPDNYSDMLFRQLLPGSSRPVTAGGSRPRDGKPLVRRPGVQQGSGQLGDRAVRCECGGQVVVQGLEVFVAQALDALAVLEAVPVPRGLVHAKDEDGHQDVAALAVVQDQFAAGPFRKHIANVEWLGFDSLYRRRTIFRFPSRETLAARRQGSACGQSEGGEARAGPCPCAPDGIRIRTGPCHVFYQKGVQPPSRNCGGTLGSGWASLKLALRYSNRAL